MDPGSATNQDWLDTLMRICPLMLTKLGVTRAQEFWRKLLLLGLSWAISGVVAFGAAWFSLRDDLAALRSAQAMNSQELRQLAARFDQQIAARNRQLDEILVAQHQQDALIIDLYKQLTAAVERARK